MRQTPKAMLGATLLSAVVLSSCGSDALAKTKTIPLMSFRSPTIDRPAIPARYTCDGKNISPPFEWGAVPAGTKDLALFIVGLTPEPSTKSYKVSVEWAVAGVNPALHRIAAGRLPSGAFLGRGKSKRESYSICPKKGSPVRYQFEAYAVPQAVVIPPNFASVAALNTLVAPSSKDRALAHGGFAAVYKRR